MMPAMPVYLDCAATTPLDPRVRAEMLRYLDEDFGNAGSRTHELGPPRPDRRRTGARPRRRRRRAARRGDVIFTSGATESNNLAILGLAAAAGDRRHIVSTAIEHHAVLEPLAELRPARVRGDARRRRTRAAPSIPTPSSLRFDPTRCSSA